MQYEQILGQIQHRGRFASRTAAENALRATLETLAERLAGGAPGNLAAQLPPEAARFLRRDPGAGRGETLSFDEFIGRIAEREGADRADAAYHARVVLDVVGDATEGTLEQVRDQLPDAYDPLFEAGSDGEMR